MGTIYSTGGTCPLFPAAGSRDYIAKQKPSKLLLPDILLQVALIVGIGHNLRGWV